MIVPPSRSPSRELRGESLGESRIARQIADLAPRDRRRTLGCRPRPIASELGRNALRPDLAATGRDSTQLRERIIDTLIAQPIA